MNFKSNATLTFKIALPVTQPVMRDSVTGAPIVPTSSLIVYCSLEVVSNPNQITLSGVDENALLLSGRMVNPKFLTAEMKVNKIADMVLKRGKDTELRGKFFILPFSDSRLGLSRHFGDFISGLFQVGG